MPASGAKTGAGTTLAFASGFFGEITKATYDGVEREAIEVTHLLSPDNAKEFIPNDFADFGAIQIEGNFLPAMGVPPITAAPASVTLTPKGSGKPYIGSAFLTSFQATMPVNEKMGFTGSIKFAGLVEES